MTPAASIDDLRDGARRRLPRFAFDFIDGGAESEDGLRRNRSDLAAIQMTPRYMRDVSDIQTGTELFGKHYAVPFGAAPVGFLNTAWPGTDLALARMAARQGMPFGVSTAASTPLEAMAEAGDGNAWFQLYLSDATDWIDSLLGRVEAAGYEVMMVTVDVAQPGKRDRDIRNGLQMPIRITPRTALDLALHPRWSLASWRAGAPELANMTSVTSGAISISELQHRFQSGGITVGALKRLRDRWQGKLLIKGLLHPEDAVLATDLGADGIVVSNHGGRQADYGPSAIAALQAIAPVVGDRTTLVLDSGIRRGADVVRARALGAAAVFAGRPFAYGAGALGAEGVQAAFDILHGELRTTLGQLGVPDFADVDAQVLTHPQTDPQP